MHKTRRFARVGWFALACVWTVLGVEARAHEPGVWLSGWGRAGIDGDLEAWEWKNAGQAPFTITTPQGDTTDGTLFVMNDGRNLYVAVRVAYVSWGTGFSMVFDNDHGGGKLTDGDDRFVAHATFYDYVHLVSAEPPGGVTSARDDIQDGSRDGRAALSVRDGETFIEAVHPLASGDANDFSLKPGDTVGFRMTLSLAETGEDGQAVRSSRSFPVQTVYGDAARFGDIVIAQDEQTPSLHSDYDGISDGVLAFGQSTRARATPPTEKRVGRDASGRMLLSGYGRARMDGALRPGEWADAGRVPVSIDTPEGGSVPGMLYAMNDDVNLYFALSFDAVAVGNSASISFADDLTVDRFDAGNDVILHNPDTRFYDHSGYVGGTCRQGAMCVGLDTERGGTNDGAAAFSSTGSRTVYEFSHPLNSGDALDIAIGPGKRIGFNLNVRLLGSTGYADTDYPAPSRIRTSRYAVYAVASDPNPEPGTMLTGRGTAAVDGVLKRGEWAQAGKTSFSITVPTGKKVEATVYAMNDADVLYMAVEFPYRADENAAAIALDGGSGFFAPGSDLIVWNEAGFGAFRGVDPRRCPGGQATCMVQNTTPDVQTFGRAVLGGKRRKSVYEFAYPLTGGDMRLMPGDTVRYRLAVQLGQGGNTTTTYFPDLFSFGKAGVSVIRISK